MLLVSSVHESSPVTWVGERLREWIEWIGLGSMHGSLAPRPFYYGCHSVNNLKNLICHHLAKISNALAEKDIILIAAYFPPKLLYVYVYITLMEP